MSRYSSVHIFEVVYDSVYFRGEVELQKKKIIRNKKPLITAQIKKKVELLKEVKFGRISMPRYSSVYFLK